jgi:hypothetical protein
MYAKAIVINPGIFLKEKKRHFFGVTGARLAIQTTGYS